MVGVVTKVMAIIFEGDLSNKDSAKVFSVFLLANGNVDWEVIRFTPRFLFLSSQEYVYAMACDIHSRGHTTITKDHYTDFRMAERIFLAGFSEGKGLLHWW